MNPETNRFEQLTEAVDETTNQTQEMERRLKQLQTRLIEHEPLVNQISARVEGLLRPDGSPVPQHWSVFTVDENVVIKDYTFRVAYVGETSILFEPVGPVVVGEVED